jgi:hypothetical protein
MEELVIGKEYEWFGQPVKLVEVLDGGTQAAVETRFGSFATAEICDLGTW